MTVEFVGKETFPESACATVNTANNAIKYLNMSFIYLFIYLLFFSFFYYTNNKLKLETTKKKSQNFSSFFLFLNDNIYLDTKIFNFNYYLYYSKKRAKYVFFFFKLINVEHNKKTTIYNYFIVRIH